MTQYLILIDTDKARGPGGSRLIQGIGVGRAAIKHPAIGQILGRSTLRLGEPLLKGGV
jgi:hypothetical protein